MHVSSNQICVKPFRADTKKVAYMKRVYSYGLWVALLPKLCMAWGGVFARAFHHCLGCVWGRYDAFGNKCVGQVPNLARDRVFPSLASGVFDIHEGACVSKSVAEVIAKLRDNQ